MPSCSRTGSGMATRTLRTAAGRRVTVMGRPHGVKDVRTRVRDTAPGVLRMRLRPEEERPIFGAVLGHALVVVSDAHLGVAPPDVEGRLLAFLEAVPTLGDCLLLNGD